MATRFCTQVPPPGSAGFGAAVNTPPADGLPQSASVLEVTCPASVVTAPPAAFWNGSGMSTFWWLGHSMAAPMSIATPIATNRPTTMRAASGLNGDEPANEWEWECECATRTA